MNADTIAETARMLFADDDAQYPLRFEPIYQCRLWGVRRLSNLLSARLPGDRPAGQAWLPEGAFH